MSYEGQVCEGLRAITERLQEVTGEGPLGIFGGEHGYGVDWDNDTFTMRPFYWGDCDCGYEAGMNQWAANNPAVHEGHDEYGACLGPEAHCEWWDRYDAEAEKRDHDKSRCSIYLPNFVFKPSGVQVSWYKYIGRGMEISGALPKNFAKACIESVTANV